MEASILTGGPLKTSSHPELAASLHNDARKLCCEQCFSDRFNGVKAPALSSAAFMKQPRPYGLPEVSEDYHAVIFFEEKKSLRISYLKQFSKCQYLMFPQTTL